MTGKQSKREVVRFLFFNNLFTGDPEVCLLDASTYISTNMSTNTISLKLPKGWKSSASFWFVQTEAQFGLREITADATKYYYVVSALGSSTATRVASFLKNPLEEEKYKTFKTHLLKTFELSDEAFSGFSPSRASATTNPLNSWIEYWIS